MSVALLFPGQGAQRQGMLADLPDSPAASAALGECLVVCAESGLEDLDSTAHLSDTEGAQLSLLIAGIVCARAIIEDGGVTPAFVAGHSVGAFAAAVAAGVLTTGEAIAAVRRRADSMRAVCAGRDWGMAAVDGLPAAAASRVADAASSPDQPLWVANVNSATQTVVAGTAAALATAEELADRAGARSFRRLDVAIASHGTLQRPTADALRDALAGTPRRTPTARYVTNVGGRTVATADAVLGDLAAAVAHPVRWYDGVRLMAELGVTCAVETEPGHVLSRLVASAAPRVTTVALSETPWRDAVARARRHTT
ncbi:malonate decarboxylase epsilon subunit [Mycolicibacterium rutilum]|uniref:[acyl-carrier-protein] S-malonyltransferase n=1 Tax=Mycolicibacterium rutilum TaxID=370526 RepID=A0A1H6J2G0_MYCRU|nr:acyltransferase domain-containing protein [Mycolicibacterium rutilum]SEH53050.1 malonate decarboxylase epsilon subunit [Mycolicibacterium rutilum]